MLSKNRHDVLILLLFILILISVNSCDSSGGEIAYDTNNCFEKESEILNASGSSDAPKLYEAIGIESGYRELRWSQIEGSIYYELEECNCPDFSGGASLYEVTELSYKPPETFMIKYYRVRAVLSNTYSGWSRILKYSF